MNALQQSRIIEHGQNLLAIFPDATERDPATLCKKLRRLEAIGAKIAVRRCNGPEYPEGEEEKAISALLNRVKDLVFGIGPENVPIFINGDPRGHALKIDDAWMRERKPKLHTDWGGYGILAPDIDGKP